MRKTRRSIAAALVTAAAVAAFAGSASAVPVSQTQQVTGTTLGTLALGVPTAAVLDQTFNPGSTASNSVGAPILVTSTGSWTLTVADAANNGHLIANTLNPSCATGEGQTNNQLKVKTSGGTSATNVASPVTVATAPAGTTGAQVANGTLANSLLAAYTLLIDPTEQMQALCDYSTTVNWTVQ
jgi:hypothetical protein